MHEFIRWWAALSWSYAALALLALVLVLAFIIYLLGQRLRSGTLPETPVFWPLVDYSAQRQEMVDWLGDRHLLARPINRQTR